MKYAKLERLELLASEAAFRLLRRLGREKWPGEWQTEARAMRQERLSSASESVLAPLWLCGMVPLANQGGRGEWPTWRTCPDWSERPISRSGMPARPRSRSLVQVQVVLPLLRELWDAVHAATFFQPRRLPGPLSNGLCVSASHVRASRPQTDSLFCRDGVCGRCSAEFAAYAIDARRAL